MLLVSQVYLSEFKEIINSLLALKMFAYVFMWQALLRLKKYLRWWWTAAFCDLLVAADIQCVKILVLH